MFALLATCVLASDIGHAFEKYEHVFFTTPFVHVTVSTMNSFGRWAVRACGDPKKAGPSHRAT